MKGQSWRESGGWAAGWIKLGACGVHPLFEADNIRRAFDRIDRGHISEKGVLSAHAALRELSAMPDVWRMKKYLRGLPPETADLLVFLYFRSLDRFMERTPRTFH